MIYDIKLVKTHIQELIDVGYTKFCPDCLSGLEKTKEGSFFCPNEMCLNEQHYDENGDDKNG